jgi:hypothetical protein
VFGEDKPRCDGLFDHPIPCMRARNWCIVSLHVGKETSIFACWQRDRKMDGGRKKNSDGRRFVAEGKETS